MLGADSQGYHFTLPLKALLKNRLLPSLLHTLFPIMAAEPPLGQLDPEDQDSDEEELEIGLVGETPKHFAVQVGCGTAAGGRALDGCGRLGTEMGSSKVVLSLLGCGHVGATFAPREALSPAGKCGLVLLVPLPLRCA